MTAMDLLTVLFSVLSLAAAATLAVLAGRTLRAARQLEAATRAFNDEALPAIEELREAAARASGEVERVDELLLVAGSIGDRVDTATEVTYRVLTSPMIKGVAIATGTRRAARRLRRSHRGGGQVGSERALRVTSVESADSARSRKRPPGGRVARRRGAERREVSRSGTEGTSQP